MAVLVLALAPSSRDTMTKKALPRIDNPEDLFQREVREVFREYSMRELIHGRLLTGIALTTDPVRVSHGLGRVPRGWLVVDTTAACTVHRDTTGTERKTYLTLIASAASTVSLWVF